MRRIARGQLDAGIEEVEGQPNRNLDEAVHEARKRLKRLRASLRLERFALGDETYQRENATSAIWASACRHLATRGS
jgi:hypothetical protein